MTKRIFTAVIGTMMLVWSGPVLAGGHNVPPPFDPSILDAELNAEIEEVVLGMAERWNSQDNKRVLEMWDKDLEIPVYLAEEQYGWFVGWEALNNYLNPEKSSGVIDVMRFQIYDVRAVRLADDLAIGVWEHQFDMKTVFGEPIGERVRSSGIFRKTDEGWRFVYYAESPKTPLIAIEEIFRDSSIEGRSEAYKTVEKAFQEQVSDGWDEFYAEAKKKKEALKK